MLRVGVLGAMPARPGRALRVSGPRVSSPRGSPELRGFAALPAGAEAGGGGLTLGGEHPDLACAPSGGPRHLS